MAGTDEADSDVGDGDQVQSKRRVLMQTCCCVHDEERDILRNVKQKRCWASIPNLISLWKDSTSSLSAPDGFVAWKCFSSRVAL